MTKQRHVLTISLILLPLVLLGFQNCGPASPGGSGDSSGSKVGLVDNLQKGQIQFVSADSQIQDEAKSADISGLCARAYDGAALKWTVWDENSQKIFATGASNCDHGQFAVTVSQLDQYVCGVDHLLVVEGSWGGSTFSHFTRRCQPLISVEDAPPQDAPMGTTCELEYSAATASEQSCQRVCYRSSQVVLTQPLDVTACSSLAASLAGR